MTPPLLPLDEQNLNIVRHFVDGRKKEDSSHNCLTLFLPRKECVSLLFIPIIYTKLTIISLWCLSVGGVSLKSVSPGFATATRLGLIGRFLRTRGDTPIATLTKSPEVFDGILLAYRRRIFICLSRSNRRRFAAFSPKNHAH